jgi:hypothetical protein
LPYLKVAAGISAAGICKPSLKVEARLVYCTPCHNKNLLCRLLSKGINLIFSLAFSNVKIFKTSTST